MQAVVYTKNNCPYCVKVKEVLQSINVKFTEYTYEKDFDRDQFYAEFGPGSTFPQVVLDGEQIGGCTDTVRYLAERNLI
jgi:glutaredoxin